MVIQEISKGTFAALIVALVVGVSSVSVAAATPGQGNQAINGYTKDQCKDDGWKTFTNPKFKNQGDCVSYFATGGRNPGNGVSTTPTPTPTP